MFDFYKHITESIPNYLMFVLFMVVAYMLFCMVTTFATDLVIKVILAIRAPMPPASVKVTRVEDQE
jgi:hypothetical protein|tara:strand:+ start:4782 stop:4979 length:198 start_codon:yes stop_codon:yes gene_type:complete